MVVDSREREEEVSQTAIASQVDGNRVIEKRRRRCLPG